MSAIAASAVDCRALRTVEEIASLESEWIDLLETTRCHRTFSSPTWYLGSCLRPGSPLAMTLRIDGRLAGVLPLFVPDDDTDAHFPTRMSDYNDAIVEDHRSDYANLLLDAALEIVPAVNLMQLRDDSALLPVVRDRRAEFHPFVGVGTFERLRDYDTWLAGRSRSFRKSLFRAQRHVDAAGLTIRELAGPVEETFLALHEQRQERSCFAIPRNRALIDFAFDRLAAAGRLRVFGLFDGERCVAVDVAMRGYESLCTWNGGFVPEYAHLSPGNVLLAHEVRTACAEGIAEFDLMRGGQSYKASWANGRRSLFTARVARGG